MIIIRTPAPVSLTVIFPNTKEGRDELARRCADIHAASVIQRIKSLKCPAEQKQALLDAVIDSVKKRQPHKKQQFV